MAITVERGNKQITAGNTTATQSITDMRSVSNAFIIHTVRGGVK